MRVWHPSVRSDKDSYVGWATRQYIGGDGAITSTGRPREVILAITYVLVVFSIIVQGLTFRRLIARIFPELTRQSST